MNLLAQGEVVIRLQKRSREWVKRRIEVVRFLDRVTVERETTLDLELSRELLDQFPTRHGRKLLPLKLVKRNHDVNVTIRDAEGIPLPQLNHGRERSLVAAGLMSKYRQYYEQHPDEAPQQSLDGVRLLKAIFDEISPPERPANLIPGPDEWEEIRKHYMDYRLVLAAVDVRPYVDRESKGAILRLVVSYPDPLPSEPPFQSGEDGVSASRSTRFREYLKTVDDWPVNFEINQVEACKDFHFELIAPPGVCVPQGTLRIETQSGTDEFPDTDPYEDRAHFFCVIPQGWTGDDVIRESSAELVLRPMEEGLARPLYRTSQISAVVLLIFFLSMGLTEAGLQISNFIYYYDTQAVVTLLLLGPTLLTGLMIRDNEHAMTKRILKKLRLRIAVGGAATSVSSIAFALGWTGWLLFTVLFVCLLMAWAMVFINMNSSLRSRNIQSNLGKAQRVTGGRHRGGRHRVRRQRGGLANRAEPQQN